MQKLIQLLQTINLPIRLATFEDFHTNNKKHLGMIYLIINEKGKAEVHRLKETTSGDMITPWIKQGRCFVIANVDDVCCELETIEKEVEWIKDTVATV